MHLDCVFSIISDNVCIMLEEMIGDSSATRRLVDEYTRVGGAGSGVGGGLLRGLQHSITGTSQA